MIRESFGYQHVQYRLYGDEFLGYVVSAVERDIHITKRGRVSEQIDAVITWVDGSDSRWLRRRKARMAGKNMAVHPISAGRSPGRFEDNGELAYCLASIRKFLPWVGTIFLITDQQVPRFLDADMLVRHRIQIVDHREIFHSYEWALPTFNTRAIETAIWRVSGIARRFLYFNDDFVVLKSTSVEAFFREHHVVLQGTWRRIKFYPGIRIRFERWAYSLLERMAGVSVTMHLLQQMRSAALGGIQRRYFHAPHVPHPIDRLTLEAFFADNPNVFEENIRFPFRDATQFSAVFLARHLEIAKGTAILEPSNEDILLSGERDSSARLDEKLKVLASGQPRFLCLQSFEKVRLSYQDRVRKILWEVLSPEIKEFRPED